MNFPEGKSIAYLHHTRHAPPPSALHHFNPDSFPLRPQVFQDLLQPSQRVRCFLIFPLIVVLYRLFSNFAAIMNQNYFHSVYRLICFLHYHLGIFVNQVGSILPYLNQRIHRLPIAYLYLDYCVQYFIPYFLTFSRFWFISLIKV